MLASFSMRRVVAVCVLALPLAGCPTSFERDPFDAGGIDAGAPMRPDAGPGFDAGPLFVDAGPGFDAGGIDAGGVDGGCPDRDGDGQQDVACGGADCDDGAPDVFFGAAETCEGRDQDCDGLIDEGGDAWCATQMGPQNTAPPVRCDMGLCLWDGCAPGFLDCTSELGCETDASSTRDNCGSCGNVCLYSQCSGGLCDPIVDIEAHDDTTCAIRASGVVLCWGAGTGGIRGDGSDADVRVAEPLLGLSAVASMDLGLRAGCAVSDVGDVACWGTGFLGDGTGFTQRALPTLAISGGVTNVAVGEQHRCAVLSTGAMRCWGRNFSETLGVPFSVSGAQATTPIDVPMVSNAVDAGASFNHTCALLQTGEVDCWGANFWGQAGIGSTSGFPPVRPGTPAVGITDAVDLAIGREHTCALRASGEARCWGRNNRGQLGDGTTVDRATPTSVVGLSNGAQIEASRFQTCVRLTTGQVACWGAAMGSTGSPRAMLVARIRDAVDIAVGQSHACALRATGEVVCWGANGSGQLGDGTNGASVIPVPIGPANL